MYLSPLLVGKEEDLRGEIVSIESTSFRLGVCRECVKPENAYPSRSLSRLLQFLVNDEW